MKTNILSGILYFLFQGIALISAQEYNVTGYLKSDITGEPVIFAHCYSDDFKFYTTCNEEGYFHLKTANQQLKLIFSHVSYIPDTIMFLVDKDTCLHIRLKELNLEEVQVVTKEIGFVEQSQSGKITISQAVINKVPSMLGEPDLIKTISFLPGVSSGNKLYSNLYVRGGGRQNNLILIDDAPTYNSNHVFGLISVFNTDAVQQLDFYKSDFPAQHGGVTSSIVDIYTKDGNSTNYSGKLKISLLYSKLFAEGPIVKNKLSFLFSGRCSYFDILMIPFYSIYKTSGTISFPGYRFYDINSKITYNISQGKKLNLSVFHGNDRFSVFDKNQYSDKPYNDELRNYFRNTMVSLQYKSDLHGSAYFRASAIYSRYKNIYESLWKTKLTENKQSREEYYFTSVENIRFKAQLDFKPGKNHSTKMGWKPAIYFVQPGYSAINEITPEGETESFSGTQKLKTAYENILYIENDYNLSDKVILNTGIRGTLFNNRSDIFLLEPRISLRYKSGNTFSLRAGYSIMNQFLHCITNNTQQSGSEFWLLSDNTFLPERSHQYNAGMSLLLPFNIELNSDIYYKFGGNVVYYNFVETDPEFLNNYNSLIYRNGKKQSYGLEIMLRIQSNNVQSLVSYTLSRNFVQFGELNQNNKFPDQQDQLHDISVVFLWYINKINSLNLNFTYNSGAPITLPVGYIKENTFYGGYYIYDGINNKRLPAFHRLDISWVRTKYRKNNRKRDFYLNIYNVYAKQNAVYMFFANNKTYKTAVNLIIPSIGYVWYF